MDNKQIEKLLGIEPAMEPLELYLRVGRLIEAMPVLNSETVLAGSSDILQWLGEAYALCNTADKYGAGMEIKSAIDNLSKHAGMGGFSIDQFISAARAIPLILYRVLALTELKAPPEYRGGFIPAHTPLAALKAIAKVFKTAKQNIMIVDPYLDANALYDFAVTADEGVNIQLLAGRKKKLAGLRPAVERWNTEHIAKRPLEVKLADDQLLHDRIIVVDNDRVWIMTQSLAHFAERSPATLVRFDDEDHLKRDYYETLWTTANPL